MRQEIEIENRMDADANPTGGKVTGTGIDIRWQDGPLGPLGPLGTEASRKEPNGAFVEGVIQCAIQRLQFFQNSKFSCRENSLALTKLQEALFWLDERTRGRIERNVEGQHKI